MNKIYLNPLFSDHMVLQRQKPIHIWGTCEGTASDMQIEVELNGNRVSAKTNGGAWTAILPSMEAETGLTLIVRTDEEEIAVSDVSIGEVWIGGGQSNMEFYMKYEADFENEAGVCTNPNIHFFDVPELCYPGQEKDFDFSRMGYWRSCDPENLEYYSAVGYYFAKKLQEELQVPVGIVGCNRGESPVVSWLPEKYATADGLVWQQDFEKGLCGQSLEDALEEYRHSSEPDRGNPFGDELGNRLLYGISNEEQKKFLEEAAAAPEQKTVASFHTKPGSLYENMLLTIVPYTVRGVIWYHGETDSQHPECYKKLWSEMIDCWRELWKEELPFICVQLAPFEQWLWCVGDQFPAIRKIQQEVSEEKKEVYLVSASDAGMRYDIHPKNKRTIGTRLALCAEKNIYGKQVSAQAPMAVEGYRDGEDVCIRFACDTESLKLNGDGIFALAVRYRQGEELQDIDLQDIICLTEGLVLRLKGLAGKAQEKIEVRFAMTGYYEVNLYSSEEIPAIPFVCEV